MQDAAPHLVEPRKPGAATTLHEGFETGRGGSKTKVRMGSTVPREGWDVGV